MADQPTDQPTEKPDAPAPAGDGQDAAPAAETKTEQTSEEQTSEEQPSATSESAPETKEAPTEESKPEQTELKDNGESKIEGMVPHMQLRPGAHISCALLTGSLLLEDCGASPGRLCFT